MPRTPVAALWVLSLCAVPALGAGDPADSQEGAPAPGAAQEEGTPPDATTAEDLTLAVPQEEPADAKWDWEGWTDGLHEALESGRFWLSTRGRFEDVDDDRFSNGAQAWTLRTVLGYESGTYHDFRVGIEFEDVTHVFDDDFNSTTNGMTDYPVVADPKDTEVNQVYVDYVGIDDLHMRYGRQEITLDNHRWIGNVAWRQNHQSFDSFTLAYSGLENTTLTCGYVSNVNRILSDDHPLGDLNTSTYLFNARYELEDIGKITGYYYHLDLNDLPGVSTGTIGARLDGKQAIGEEVDLLYQAEYAHQSDAGDNDADLDESYWLLELGGVYKGFTVKVANEHLGGSGEPGEAVSTPLATGHKFNGFADVFLATPDTGLDDTYVSVAKKLYDVKCAAIYHNFESDSDGIDYGDELDVVLGYDVTDKLSLGFKYASFDADEAFDDVDKIMAWFNWKLL
jgi:hypothetical protein